VRAGPMPPGGSRPHPGYPATCGGGMDRVSGDQLGREHPLARYLDVFLADLANAGASHHTLRRGGRRPGRDVVTGECGEFVVGDADAYEPVEIRHPLGGSRGRQQATEACHEFHLGFGQLQALRTKALRFRGSAAAAPPGGPARVLARLRGGMSLSRRRWTGLTCRGSGRSCPGSRSGWQSR
jgi:hypothetical protein